MKLGALSKSTPMLNSIWLKRATKRIIGATRASILDLMSKGCMSHKPVEHDAWKAQKDELNKKRGKNSGSSNTQAATLKSVPSATASTASTNASELSLAKTLHKALATTTGLSENEFQKIWQNCCDALGN